MEIPYAGRAIINDNFDGIDIIIPAKRNLFVLVGACAWLIISFYFGLIVSTNLLSVGAAGVSVFVYIFLTIIVIQGIFAVNRLWLNLAGKELIHISQGVITIQKKGDLFKRTKSYDLAQCTGFCAAEVEMPIYNYNNRTAGMLRKQPNPGTISFTYDVVDTIQFGDYLSEAEANHILDRLRAKKLIS